MTKNLNYLIRLTYDKSYKGYVADVVNLYGCMSQGKTKKEAIDNAKKAIRSYMEAMEKTDKTDKSGGFVEKLLMFQSLLSPLNLSYAKAGKYFWQRGSQGLC